MRNSLLQILVRIISFLPGPQRRIADQRAHIVQRDVDCLDHDASETEEEGKVGERRERRRWRPTEVRAGSARLEPR